MPKEEKKEYDRKGDTQQPKKNAPAHGKSSLTGTYERLG
jgi:hypothetical protein